MTDQEWNEILTDIDKDTAKDSQAQALYWYEKSAAGGDEGAQQELARIKEETP
jgi:TPR repeat protein